MGSKWFGHGSVRRKLLDLGNNRVPHIVHRDLDGILEENERVRFHGLNRFDSARSAEHGYVSITSYSYQI